MCAQENLCVSFPTKRRIEARLDDVSREGMERLQVVSFAPGPPRGGRDTASSVAGPAVAGRATMLVQLTVAGRLAERWFQDRDTGLLLRREQVSPTGAVVRSVGFDQIALGT